MITIETAQRPPGSSFLEECDQTHQLSAVSYLADAIAEVVQPGQNNSLILEEEEE